MIVGCDIGTGFAKGVVLQDGHVACMARVPTEARPREAVETVLGTLAAQLGVSRDEWEEVVVTGWGQSKAGEGRRTAAIVNCLSRAAAWSMPTCRTVLCLGTQQSIALSVNDKARVLRYVTNDKCASGAGKFLEVILEALGCSVQESAEIARAADKKLAISSQCTVFAESEVVSLVNEGESVANIVEAILGALTKSTVSLCKKINPRNDLVLGGGLGANERIVSLLEEGLGMKVHVFRPEPDLIGAVGAALMANTG